MSSIPSQSVEGTSVAMREVVTRLDSLGRQLSRVEELLGAQKKPLLTIDEVADLTGRSAYTVRRWVAEGRLHATRVSGTGPRGRLLVDRRELDRLVHAGLGESIPGTRLDSQPVENSQP